MYCHQHPRTVIKRNSPNNKANTKYTRKALRMPHCTRMYSCLPGAPDVGGAWERVGRANFPISELRIVTRCPRRAILSPCPLLPLYQPARDECPSSRRSIQQQKTATSTAHTGCHVVTITRMRDAMHCLLCGPLTSVNKR